MVGYFPVKVPLPLNAEEESLTMSATDKIIAGVLAASLLAPTANDGSSSSSRGSSAVESSSSLFGSSKPTQRQPQNNPWSQISEGLDVTMIGDLLGTHQPRIGLGATDLGMMAPLAGSEFAIIFGDSFSGNGFGHGEWMSPVGVVAEMDEDGRIRFKRPLNNRAEVTDLVRYSRGSDNNLTLIPSDVINLNGTLYMQGMWNRGLGNVESTQIWKSTDGGKTWETVGMTSGAHMRGQGNLISWEKGPDGFIYVVSSGFNRKDPVYLSRFKQQDMGDRRKWQNFDPTSSTWGTTYKPILSQDVRAGEMNLRFIDGHWVLAMFNEHTRSIEVRVSKDIARDWNAIKPARVVVAGDGGWGSKQTENNFAQLYGGYIVPGSTLDNLDIVVSQWQTSNNAVYRSVQFNVKGLREYFGLTPNAATAGTVGNENVVTIEEAPVTAETVERLGAEAAIENGANLTLIPLGK